MSIQGKKPKPAIVALIKVLAKAASELKDEEILEVLQGIFPDELLPEARTVRKYRRNVITGASTAWDRTNMDSDDARLVLESRAEFQSRLDIWPAVSTSMAEWIVWVRRASPSMPLWAVWQMAAEFEERSNGLRSGERQDMEELDYILAHAKDIYSNDLERRHKHLEYIKQRWGGDDVVHVVFPLRDAGHALKKLLADREAMARLEAEWSELGNKIGDRSMEHDNNQR